MGIKRGGFIDKLTDKVFDMDFLITVALITYFVYLGYLALIGVDDPNDNKKINYKNVVVIVNETGYDIECQVDNGMIERVVDSKGVIKTTIKTNNKDDIICKTKNNINGN